MRERVAADKSGMLDMLLRRTSTPAFVLDNLVLAAFGVSLKVDDRGLFDQLAELSRHRNAIVHEGQFADGCPLSGKSSPDRLRVIRLVGCEDHLKGRCCGSVAYTVGASR